MTEEIQLIDGTTIAYDDVGAGPAVVLLHGWPETKFSWRHQVPALAAAGYRVIAIDLPGYGDSSKDGPAARYALRPVTEAIMEMLGAIEVTKPVLVGHDWGSIVMWAMAVTHPDRFAAVASLNVPYRGWCTAFPPTDYIREHLADRFGYVLYFQEEGSAESAFEADPELWLSGVYTSIAKDPDFLSSEELDTFVASFRGGGMVAPLSYYRNIDANHADFSAFENASIELPTLMVAADSDPVLPRSLVEGMERWVPQLTVVDVSDAGHWVQQEQPEQVNAALIDFLDGLDLS